MCVYLNALYGGEIAYYTFSVVVKVVNIKQSNKENHIPLSSCIEDCTMTNEHEATAITYIGYNLVGFFKSF